jgi:hypothetical protein
VATILAAAFLVTGVTFAQWSSGLKVMVKTTSGAFDLIFGDQKDVQLYLTDKEGQVARQLNEVSVTLGEDAKEIQVTMKGPLPAEQLTNGAMLLLNYPVKMGETGTYDNLKACKPDMKKPVGYAKLEACVQYLTLNGNRYVPQELSAFALPLEFDIFRAMDNSLNSLTKTRSLTGTLYLKPTESCLQQLKQLPREITLEAETLENSYLGKEDNGETDHRVTVEYTGTIPLYFDQN